MDIPSVSRSVREPADPLLTAPTRHRWLFHARRIMMASRARCLTRNINNGMSGVNDITTVQAPRSAPLGHAPFDEGNDARGDGPDRSRMAGASLDEDALASHRRGPPTFPRRFGPDARLMAYRFARGVTADIGHQR